MTYALIELTTSAIVSPSAVVPALLRGLPDHVLAAPAEHIDPAPEDWETRGLWPVVPDAMPDLTAAEIAVPAGDDTLQVDAEARVVRRPWLVQPAPPPPVPPSVTARQARLALLAAGLLDDVETMLADPARRATQIEWEYATVVERASPLVEAIGGALGLTAAEIDDLFRVAATL